MVDYYKTLGMTPEATQAEIKKAYRKLSIKFHPDKNDGDVFFEHMFIQIQEAYEVLGNAEAREAYDYRYSGHEDSYDAHSTMDTPVITHFSVDNECFYNGDEIQFYWETYHATDVEIRPFGAVAIQGRKTYRLKNVNQQYINVELVATDSITSTSVSAFITLENLGFETSQATQEEERFWSAKGRLRRRTYGIRVLLLSIVCGVFMVLGEESRNDIEGFWYIGTILTWICMAIQTIKRVHDLDKSGWWILLFLVPYVNMVFMLYILFAKGTEGGNAYGNDPKW